MLRIVPAVLAASVVFSTPAFAGKAENCAKIGEITAEAVKLRKSGLYTEKQAGKALKADAGVFTDVAVGIAQWIWTLPEDQLTDEVATAAKTQCLAT